MYEKADISYLNVVFFIFRNCSLLGIRHALQTRVSYSHNENNWKPLCHEDTEALRKHDRVNHLLTNIVIIGDNFH